MVMEFISQVKMTTLPETHHRLRHWYLSLRRKLCRQQLPYLIGMCPNPKSKFVKAQKMKNICYGAPKGTCLDLLR